MLYLDVDWRIDLADFAEYYEEQEDANGEKTRFRNSNFCIVSRAG